MTPLDFFIWGHLKNAVYATTPTTREDLETRVRQAIQSITPRQLVKVKEQTAKREFESILKSMLNILNIYRDLLLIFFPFFLPF